MEIYEGVKFAHRTTRTTFSCDTAPLTALHRWSYIFSQLGLTPVHREGAYGNQSCRTGPSSFFITRSGMMPSADLREADFCHVVGYDRDVNTFISEGISPPSSESLLHWLLYMSQPGIHAILHGHSQLFLNHANNLSIPTTSFFQPYGSVELAESALALMDGVIRFFILKDHGFVALGRTVEEAGRLTLDYLSQLIVLVGDTC